MKHTAEKPQIVCWKSLGCGFPQISYGPVISSAAGKAEEILFLLPEINLYDAKAVAERIRQKIEQQS